MKFLLSLVFIFALGAPAPAHADGALSQADTNVEIQKCMDKFIPPGSKDADMKWYDVKGRCEVSSRVPMSKSACENAVNSLKKLADSLNEMITSQCREYVPQLTVIGCTSDSQQLACLQKEKQLLEMSRNDAAKVQAVIQQYVAKTKELKKMGLDGAASVEQVLESCEANRESLSKINPALAQTTGTQTLGDFYNSTNAGQGADPLKKLIGSFTQNNSDISGTAGAAAIASQGKNLDQSWRQLDQVKSPLALEHLTNFLDAQEMQVKMTQYQQQMQNLDKQVQNYYGANTQAANQLTTAGQEAGTSGGENASYGGAGSGGGGMASAGENSGDRSSSGGFVPSFEPLRTRPMDSTALASATAAPSAQATNAVALGHSAAGSADAQDATGGSRSGALNPKTGSALREALREKLNAASLAGSASALGAAGTGNGTGGNGTAASGFAGGPGNAGSGGRQPASVAGDGFTGDTFEGSLNKDGFSMRGGDSEKSVHSFIQDLENAQGASSEMGIGSAEGLSLFERVKSFHQKCARKGCVSNARLAKE